MPIDTLNADHIGQVGGGFEPQRQSNGLLRIAGLAGNETEVITLSLAAFPLPKSNVAIIEVAFLNQIRKFAGRTTYDDLSVQFNDYVDQNTAKVLADWFYLVHDPVTGRTAFKSEYARNGTWTLYDPTGGSDRVWECQGIWISQYDPGEIDMEADDRVRITATLTVDRAIYRQSIPA